MRKRELRKKLRLVRERLVRKERAEDGEREREINPLTLPRWERCIPRKTCG